MKSKIQWVQQALNEGKHPFFIQIPITNTFHRYDNTIKQDVTTIVGLGSKVEKSRTGHLMSQHFINKMKQRVSDNNNPLPLLINHDPNQIAGTVKELRQSSTDEFVPISQLLTPHPNPIVDAPRAKIEHWIQNNVPLGYSIGGVINKFNITKEGTYDVQDGDLIEMTVTEMPALKSSDGSIQPVGAICKDGVCGQMVQQIISGPYMPELITQNIGKSNAFLTQITQSMGGTEGGFNDLQSKLQSTIYEKLIDPVGNKAHFYVQDVIPDSPVTSGNAIIDNYDSNKFLKIPFTVNGDGTISLGELVEVQPNTDYVPVKKQMISTFKQFIQDVDASVFNTPIDDDSELEAAIADFKDASDRLLNAIEADESDEDDNDTRNCSCCGGSGVDDNDDQCSCCQGTGLKPGMPTDTTYSMEDSLFTQCTKGDDKYKTLMEIFGRLAG